MTKGRSVPVSERALVQRINRKLPPGHRVVKLRGRAAKELGTYVLTDEHRVSRQNVDLTAVARKLGVLKPYEELSG